MLSDGLPELTDDMKKPTRENENRVSLYLIMCSRLNVSIALASVISRLSVFRGVIIHWCLTHSIQKKSSVSTPQQVELTAPTEWEHIEFMNLITTVCQNTRCHIRAKVTFKNLTSGCYIMLIRSLAWIWSCHFSWQPQNICPSPNPVGFQSGFAWNDKDTVIKP